MPFLPSRRVRARHVAFPERRGATLVFVAVFSAVVVGIAAFSIDVSRLYMGVNELQTRADATALQGAMLLQRNPATPQLSATATYASNNEVLGGRVALNESDVTPGFWEPTTGTFTARNWDQANAVRVTARNTAGLLFGPLISTASTNARRSAIAWVANIVGTECLKPWGISRSLFQTRNGLDLTTQSGINAMRNLLATTAGPGQLTVVLSPDVNAGSGGSGNGNSNGGNNNSNGGGNNNSNGGNNNSVIAPDAFYQAVTGPGNASPESYEALVTGTGCGNGTAEYVVGATFVQPGQGAQIVNKSDAIVRQTNMEQGPCKKRDATDATCFDPALPGFASSPIIVVPLTIPAATQGQPNRAQMVMMTEFRLMCAFTTGNQGNPLQPATDSCPWLQSIGRPASGYRRGTIVGYPLSGAVALGQGTVLGNTRSTGQRLILVQ